MTLSRKHILGVLAMVSFALVASCVALALAPAWLPVLLVKPGLASGLAEKSSAYVMHRTMAAAMKGVRK